MLERKCEGVSVHGGRSSVENTGGAKEVLVMSESARARARRVDGPTLRFAALRARAWCVLRRPLRNDILRRR